MDAQLRLIPRAKGPRSADQAPRAADAPDTPRRPARAAAPSSTDERVERVEAPTGWRIDESAKERGRAGISRAREALRQARRSQTGEHHTTAA